MRGHHPLLALDHRALLERRADARVIDKTVEILHKRMKHPDGAWGNVLTRLLSEMAEELKKR